MPFGMMGGKTVSSNRTMVLLGDGAENNTNIKLFLPLMVNVCKCDCVGEEQRALFKNAQL